MIVVKKIRNFYQKRPFTNRLLKIVYIQYSITLNHFYENHYSSLIQKLFLSNLRPLCIHLIALEYMPPPSVQYLQDLKILQCLFIYWRQDWILVSIQCILIFCNTTFRNRSITTFCNTFWTEFLQILTFCNTFSGAENSRNMRMHCILSCSSFFREPLQNWPN